jgi:hypothetical protein
MDAVTHPAPPVAAAVSESFVPYRANLFEKNPHFKEIVGRTPVPWAPTTIALVPRSQGAGEIRRWTGWLAPGDYLAELALVRGLAAIQSNRFEPAIEILTAALDAALDEAGSRHAAPELLFWRGMARFRAGGRDMAALAEDHEALIDRWPDSPWAQRAEPIRDR